MTEENRILVVDRHQDFVDSVTRVLEGVGCIVAGTLSDATAIDMALSSEFNALLIGDVVPNSDAAYIAARARNGSPGMAIVKIHNPDSVLTQLRVAGLDL